MMVFGVIGGVLLFFIALISLPTLLGVRLLPVNQSTGREQHLYARQILEQRYARGEINREQYLSMLEDIR